MVDHLLQGCLYFTANSLARSLTSIAEEEFKKQVLLQTMHLLLCWFVKSQE